MAKTAARCAPPAPRDPVQGGEEHPHGCDVHQEGGVPVAPEQQIKGSRQGDDERRLKAQHGIQFREITEETALRQGVVHGKAVGQIPGVVPIGRSSIELQPEQRGGRKHQAQQTSGKAALSGRSHFEHCSSSGTRRRHETTGGRLRPQERSPFPPKSGTTCASRLRGIPGR